MESFLIYSDLSAWTIYSLWGKYDIFIAHRYPSHWNTLSDLWSDSDFRRTRFLNFEKYQCCNLHLTRGKSGKSPLILIKLVKIPTPLQIQYLDKFKIDILAQFHLPSNLLRKTRNRILSWIIRFTIPIMISWTHAIVWLIFQRIWNLLNRRHSEVKFWWLFQLPQWNIKWYATSQCGVTPRCFKPTQNPSSVYSLKVVLSNYRHCGVIRMLPIIYLSVLPIEKNEEDLW